MKLVAYMEYKLWCVGYGLKPFEYEPWLRNATLNGARYSLIPGF